MGLVFLATGLLIMAVFSPWNPLLDKVADYLGRIGLIFVLFFAQFAIRKQKNYMVHKQLLLGLLIMAIAVSLDWVFSLFLINSLGVNENSITGTALLKLNECFVVVGSVILFTYLTNNSLSSIYIQKGNLKLGLRIGLIAFIIAAVGSISASTFLFKGQDFETSIIISWIPWILIFIFANASMEEVLFRGLFLRKLEPFFGKMFSNILIALVFTSIHFFTSYTSDQILFVAILFPLAFAWGYIIQKT